MKKTIFPQDQTFWYLKRDDVEPLRTNKEADVVVIGGGMAGLTTAHAFAKKGKKVILLEAFYCGAGASGKSSGFITPNGEIGLSEFIARYGVDGGKTIWDAIDKQGVEHIRATIKHHQIACDYREEDALEVASTEADVKILLQEVENLAKFGYTTNFIKKENLHSVLGSEKYYGGITYPKGFGINAYKYCQAMKDILRTQGVEIYEETPALTVQEHLVTSLHATIKAEYIIICADRFIPTLGKLAQEIYHVQNFLLISETLPQDQIKKIFPGKRLMVWDTDLIYQFYRMTGDRLLIGGGSPWNAYDKKASCGSDYMYKKLSNYITDAFPCHQIQFEQMWVGLIGVSKDIAPISGRDKDTKSIYYIGAAAGLPIAAMLGNYCADHLLDGADTLRDYFSPYRKFRISGALQSVLGTKLSFALSNWMSHGNT
jgi:gamma-glutamylputrescine oxidase